MTRVAPTPALARLRGQFPALTAPRVVLHSGACGAARAATAGDALRGVLGNAIVESACDGACWAAPAATVQRDGHQHRFARLGDGVPEALMRCVTGDCDDEYAGRGEYGILERLGRQDGTFEDAVRQGAYAALAHASSVGTDRTMDAVRTSSFAVRYGVPSAPDLLAVAAGDDGSNDFIECHLLEGDSHRVIEGILVACIAAGVPRARVHLGGQRASARRAFEDALEQAERHGIFVGSALGGTATEIEVSDLPPEGRSVNAMSIEAVSALTTVFDRPPPPTRLVALSGAVARPGLYEVPVGGATTWTGILAMAGATPGLVPGLLVGAAGEIVPPEAFEDVVTPAALGNGVVVALPRDAEA